MRNISRQPAAQMTQEMDIRVLRFTNRVSRGTNSNGRSMETDSSVDNGATSVGSFSTYR